MKLSIRLCSSARYLYVFKQVVRKIAVAAQHRDDVHIVFVSDTSEECKTAFSTLQGETPEAWHKEHRPIPLKDTGAPYKTDQQVLIAKMHGEGFTAARQAGAEQCWTVEADVLVPPDALRMMEWALCMPQADGSPYYDMAYCTYPNGSFIGGFGDYQHPIAEDFTPEERELTEEVKARYETHKEEEKKWIADKKRPDEEWQKKAKELAEDIKKCPPRGNVFALNAQQYRRRGWLDSAYPGIGRGAIVPVDWCGEGCNLLSKKALLLANYEGYDGGGTQDLFLIYRKFKPAGIRIACITHTICDHVKLRQDETTKEEKLVHLQAMHEQLGDCQGHLRVLEKPWVEV